MTIRDEQDSLLEEIAGIWDFAGTRRHHIRSGLRLTPSERLKWLEDTVDEMRRLQGRARLGHTVGTHRKILVLEP